MPRPPLRARPRSTARSRIPRPRRIGRSDHRSRPAGRRDRRPGAASSRGRGRFVALDPFLERPRDEAEVVDEGSAWTRVRVPPDGCRRAGADRDAGAGPRHRHRTGMIDPHPLERRDRGEAPRFEPGLHGVIVAVDARVDRDAGMAAGLAHLRAAPSACCQNHRRRRRRRHDVDVHLVASPLGEGPAVAHQPRGGVEDQPAVGGAVEPGLVEVVADLVEREVGVPDDRGVARRDQLEDRLGVLQRRTAPATARRKLCDHDARSCRPDVARVH